MVETIQATVEFESIGTATEILGGTQANFVVHRPGQHGKEVAVVLNVPAATYAAKAVGVADTPEFQESATRRLGQAWLERVLARGEHADSVVFLSRAILEREPGLIDALR
ncbi:MAG: hypothetical protein ACKVT1_07430 [Dehalococcoidia bacterium]